MIYKCSRLHTHHALSERRTQLHKVGCLPKAPLQPPGLASVDADVAPEEPGPAVQCSPPKTAHSPPNCTILPDFFLHKGFWKTLRKLQHVEDSPFRAVAPALNQEKHRRCGNKIQVKVAMLCSSSDTQNLPTVPSPLAMLCCSSRIWDCNSCTHGCGNGCQDRHLSKFKLEPSETALSFKLTWQCTDPKAQVK